MRSFERIDGADLDVSGAEGVVGYSFANGLTTRLGINYKSVEDDNKDYEYLTLPVYVNYQVSPAFNVWAEARFDLGSDEEATKNSKEYYIRESELAGYAENVYSVGARYTF